MFIKRHHHIKTDICTIITLLIINKNTSVFKHNGLERGYLICKQPHCGHHIIIILKILLLKYFDS